MPSTNNSKLVYHPLPTSEKEIDEHALNYKSPFTYSDMKKSDGYSNFYDTEEHKEEEYVQKQGILLQLLSHFLTAISYVIFFLFLPVTYWICVKKVRDEEKMVIFRLGKMIGAKGRLLFFIQTVLIKNSLQQQALDASFFSPGWIGTKLLM